MLQICQMQEMDGKETLCVPVKPLKYIVTTTLVLPSLQQCKGITRFCDHCVIVICIPICID